MVIASRSGRERVRTAPHHVIDVVDVDILVDDSHGNGPGRSTPSTAISTWRACPSYCCRIWDHGVQHKGPAGDVDDARQNSADALVDIRGDRKFE
jgi:hypothetical protein